MSPAFLAGVFGTSLLSSLHCAGMCGPFVAFYSAGGGGAKPHVVYHAERALTYIALGGAAGALGSGLDALGQGFGAVRIAALVASALTVLWGLLAFLPQLRPTGVPTFWSGRLVQLKTRAPVTKAFVLGFTTPLLPCGTLYAFVTLAAGTGSAVNGALTLAVFFLGTLPGLVGLGTLTSKLSLWARARLPRVLGAALVLVGLLGVYERSQVWGHPADSEGCHGHH
jgi:uncharacterized protein